MRTQLEHSGKQLGWSLALGVIILTLFGLIIIFTSSSVNAGETYGDMFFYLKKQAIAASVGIFSFLIIQILPFKFIEKLTVVIFALVALLLFLTIVPGFGHSVNGASRWIKLGPVSLQPAELCKLALIIFLAKNLSRKSTGSLQKPAFLMTNLAPLAIYVLGLMLQPDFGSSLLLVAITFVLLFVAGLPMRFVLSSIFAIIVAGAIAIIHAPYRLARLTSFLDPWESARTGGFQIIQSYLGFYNGGLLGLGLGESRQKLYFLPEAHTDFILSVVGEELGLFGVIFTIAMFCFITLIGMRITHLQKDNFKKYMAFGITALFAIQAFINMGVAMGLLPTKGMPLPFISHGSTSLIVFLWASALLVKIGIETEVKSENSKQQTVGAL